MVKGAAHILRPDAAAAPSNMALSPAKHMERQTWPVCRDCRQPDNVSFTVGHEVQDTGYGSHYLYGKILLKLRMATF